MSAFVKRIVDSTAHWHPLDRQGVAVAILEEVARWFDEMPYSDAAQLAALWLRAEIAKNEDDPGRTVPPHGSGA